MVFAGVRVYTGITNRRNLAEKEFSSLADLSAKVGSSGYMSESFRETIIDSITRSRTLQGVIISGPNGEYAFERDRGTSIAWTRDSPYFKTQFGISREPFFQKIRVNGEAGVQNVTLRAVYNYIDYDFLITILKRTLLMVLATLCLALFTLIFQFLLINPSSPKGEIALKVKPEPYREKEKHTKEKEQEQEQQKNEPKEPIDDSFFTDLEKNSPPEKINRPLQPISSPDSPKETAGLYAPRSYIGREEYTRDKLTAELSRCTSFGQDLVLMLMEIQEGAVKVEDTRFRFLADETVKFFLRRDLIFERGAQGITVILPSIDLDQGFANSQKFHKLLISKYAETFKTTIELYMGLSSRADRLIDEERFIFEASGALKKAMGDPSAPIVAFRSDPEKYRAFMAAQNKSYP
jgi:hypothetical protein